MKTEQVIMIIKLFLGRQKTFTFHAVDMMMMMMMAMMGPWKPTFTRVG